MSMEIPDNGKELKEPVDLAKYLFTRLRQIGIRSVHGVPGDYNLLALDYALAADLLWVGNCNELNAGYAADGYARIKGISAVITKCGVGELSIVNAIAGAYSEYVPLVHIVGTPSTVSRGKNILSQHTLSNGDHKIFETITQKITCATAILDSASDPATLIDEVIMQCLVQSRPVYIALPIDMVQRKVEGRRLLTPISTPVHLIDEAKEGQAVEIILGHLQTALHPAVLVDVGTIRRGAVEHVNTLIRKLQVPTFVTPIGKSGVDEAVSCYKGVYAANGSDPAILDYFRSVDFLLHIGSIKSDSTTGWFGSPAPRATIVELPVDNRGILINDCYFPNIRLPGLIRRLADQLVMPLALPKSEPSPRSVVTKTDTFEYNPNAVIKHGWLWPRLSQWLQEGDVVITETGTANYGIRETIFPCKVRAICQPLWSSIGYATAACQGAALASKELANERTILFTGEGSFQVSGQELSTMIRHKLNPIIFIICNGGYTTERFIHGAEAPYNDIQQWKYTDLCSVYSGQEHTLTYRVETAVQLEQLLSSPNFNVSKYLRLVEVHMRQDDAPIGLVNTVNALPERG